MSTTLRARREASGLSQAELAARAGVSRQLIGAAEAGRNLPRVDAALAIAAALGVDVAVLFGSAPRPLDVITGETPQEGALIRAGRVGEQVVTVPSGLGAEGWETADGVITGAGVAGFGRSSRRLKPGLVVAGCEPGLEMLEGILRESGMAAVTASSSSARAIDALDAGRVHAAVVHGPEGTVANRVGARHIDRFAVARWRVGLAAPADSTAGWWQDALNARSAVVQREAGAGVQRTFEEAALGPVPGPRVSTHLAAARRAILTGLPAVTIEPAALAVGAAFHPLDVHEAELWVGRAWIADGAVAEALNVIAGNRFQRRLEAVGGYDLAGSGGQIG